MQIAIDALGLPPFGGARTSALGWLKALGHQDRTNEYLVFLSHPEQELAPFPNFKQRIAPISNRFGVRLWAQCRLPFLLKRERVDLLHSMKNLGLIAAPCPTVVAVNDLTHLILMDQYSFIDGFYWRVVQPRILGQAKRVIAISENTKQDLIHWYGLDDKKIVVIYPSCDPRFRRDYDPEDLEEVRTRYRLPSAMLLFVGGLGIHKNVVTLIRAFARIITEIPHGLVVVGGMHHTSSDCTLNRLARMLRIEERVWFLGSVPASDLPLLYRLADLCVFPSLNEGFGLALLEAMVSGTPILASNRGSIPEVIGDAGRLVTDPLNDQAFATAIVELLADREALAWMRERGLARSRRFSWQHTAVSTLALYREIVHEQS